MPKKKTAAVKKKEPVSYFTRIGSSYSGKCSNHRVTIPMVVPDNSDIRFVELAYEGIDREPIPIKSLEVRDRTLVVFLYDDDKNNVAEAIAEKEQAEDDLKESEDRVSELEGRVEELENELADLEAQVNEYDCDLEEALEEQDTHK